MTPRLVYAVTVSPALRDCLLSLEGHVVWTWSVTVGFAEAWGMGRIENAMLHARAHSY